MEINVARDFDPYPWGRPQGERFRDTILIPRLRMLSRNSGERLVVDLDGCRQLGSSFLDEAFAGLIRKGVVNRREFDQLIEVRASSPAMDIFLDAVRDYVKKARVGT